MRCSPQQHRYWTRFASFGIAFLTPLSLILTAGQFVNREYFHRFHGAGHIPVVVVLMLITMSCTVSVGHLLCEILRQVTSARCTTCSGASRFVPCEGGVPLKVPIVYQCEKCGNVDELSTTYAQDAPWRVIRWRKGRW